MACYNPGFAYLNAAHVRRGGIPADHGDTAAHKTAWWPVGVLEMGGGQGPSLVSSSPWLRLLDAAAWYRCQSGSMKKQTQGTGKQREEAT